MRRKRELPWIGIVAIKSSAVFILEKPSLCSKGDKYECDIKTNTTACRTDCDFTASKALGSECSGDCCKICYKNCKKCSKFSLSDFVFRFK